MNHKLLSALIFILLSVPAQAAFFRSGEVVKIDSIINDDCYIAGKQVLVTNKINGDLLVAAQSVHINNDIEGSLQLAAETIEINGKVDRAVRSFSRTFNLWGNVNGDVIIFSESAYIHKGAVIEGDLIVYSGTVTIDGLVKGNIIIYTKNGNLNGRAEGAAKINAEEITINGYIRGPSKISANTIHLRPDARFVEDVRYWQKEGEEKVAPEVSNGSYIFDPSLKPKEETDPKKTFIGLAIGFLIWYLLYGVLLLIILAFIFPAWFDLAGQNMLRDPLRSFGFGMLYLIVTPFLIMLLFMIVIGIPLALLLMALYFFSIVSGMVITALVLTYLIKFKYNKNWSRWGIIGIALLIILALNIIMLIPILGFIISLLLFAASVGALLMNLGGKTESTN